MYAVGNEVPGGPEGTCFTLKDKGSPFMEKWRRVRGLRLRELRGEGLSRGGVSWENLEGRKSVAFSKNSLESNRLYGQSLAREG